MNYSDSDVEENKKSHEIVADTLSSINARDATSKYCHAIDIVDLLIMENEFDNRIINLPHRRYEYENS